MQTGDPDGRDEPSSHHRRRRYHGPIIASATSSSPDATSISALAVAAVWNGSANSRVPSPGAGQTRHDSTPRSKHPCRHAPGALDQRRTQPRNLGLRAPHPARPATHATADTPRSPTRQSRVFGFSPRLAALVTPCRIPLPSATIPITERRPAVQFNPASMRSRISTHTRPCRATSQKPPDSRLGRFVIP